MTDKTINDGEKKDVIVGLTVVVLLVVVGFLLFRNKQLLKPHLYKLTPEREGEHQEA